MGDNRCSVELKYIEINIPDRNWTKDRRRINERILWLLHCPGSSKSTNLQSAVMNQRCRLPSVVQPPLCLGRLKTIVVYLFVYFYKQELLKCICLQQLLHAITTLVLLTYPTRKWVINICWELNMDEEIKNMTTRLNSTGLHEETRTPWKLTNKSANTRHGCAHQTQQQIIFLFTLTYANLD